MDTLLRYRGYVILTLIYAIVFGSYVLYERRPQPEPIKIVQPTTAPTPTSLPIQVHVAGAVQRPGVYALTATSRLIQAVEAAGGLTSEADQERINLAERLRDGQQVYIPKVGTLMPPRPTSVAASSPGNASELININTASAAELEALPGIGPIYAQRIVVYREEHGPFADPTQITEVKGIGPALYERIKERIVVR